MKYMDFNGLDLSFKADSIYFWSCAHQTLLVSTSYPSSAHVVPIVILFSFIHRAGLIRTNLNLLKKYVFDPVAKIYGFHAGGHGFEIHKVKKYSIIYIGVWKCVEWLDLQPMISKKKYKVIHPKSNYPNKLQNKCSQNKLISWQSNTKTDIIRQPD